MQRSLYGKDIGHIYKSLSKLSGISSSCEQSVVDLHSAVEYSPKVYFHLEFDFRDFDRYKGDVNL